MNHRIARLTLAAALGVGSLGTAAVCVAPSATDAAVSVPASAPASAPAVVDGGGDVLCLHLTGGAATCVGNLDKLFPTL